MTRILALILLFFPAPAYTGAWPRETGRVFTAAQLSFAELADQTKDGYNSLYAEYGLTDVVTLGGKAWSRQDGQYGDAMVFARRSIAVSGDHWVSGELALGVRSYASGAIYPMIQPGISWGKGFGSKFGHGWMGIEAVYGLVPGTGDHWTKVDATLGLKPDNDTHLILQLRAHDDWLGRAVTFAPTYVRRITPRLSVEAGLTRRLNGGAKGVGLLWGTWTEF